MSYWNTIDEYVTTPYRAAKTEAIASDAQKLAAELNAYKGSNSEKDVVAKYELSEFNHPYSELSDGHYYFHLADGGEVWHQHVTGEWVCE